ncbi:hypothetical protein ACJMK2_024292 [Sinanodonta woodiana]|uniref:GATOR2 complex protein WDR24 n=1 Tax=Sinanodonta woodiana TaxID=1069815 RepID=A0ABD3T6Y4_SINWO
MSSNSSKTMYCNTEGQVNSIAVNRDATHIVAAGRSVFKIFGVDDDKFIERLNLRVGKNLNLSYSTLDIAWNHFEDNILASAATNGAVVIWDINRPQRNKQEFVFQEHKRTVNRVTFHEKEHNMLLSGSQDGSMKLFDIRKKEVGVEFSIGSTSVRDVQFCPCHLSYFTFASADESGNVLIWDMRKPDRVERQFTAHNGPVFTLDWHPEDRTRLATAGRDKMIKVWDTAKCKLTRCIQTIASVSKIRWRPLREFYIASCSLLVDSSINIWDIRRPFIPFATFENHKDVTTSIVWKKDDPHILYSGSKDCFIYQHLFKDAKRPGDLLVPAGLDVSTQGLISHACTDKHEKTQTSSGRQFFKKTPSRNEKFLDATSYLFTFSHLEESLSMDWFVISAQRYLLTGRPLEDLLDHNANVARDLGRHQVAQTWEMLKTLYCTNLPSIGVTGNPNLHQQRTISVSSDKMDTIVVKDKSEKVRKDARFKSKADPEDKTLDGTSGGSDEEISDKEINERNLSNIARGQINPPTDWDIYYGGGENSFLDLDSLADMENNKQPLTLPTEAFHPRHEIASQTRSLEHFQNESPASGNEGETSTGNGSANPYASDKETSFTILTADPLALKFPEWNFKNIVVDMMKYHAREFDVQTPACMLIILGNRIRSAIDHQIQENWLLSYIDLLGRFKLWSIANEVIKLSQPSPVSHLNQQSTTVHVTCNKCSRQLQRSGWSCDRCKSVTNLCSICHQPVKGLYVWCQGCSHGGHMQHIQDWLSLDSQCPAGCGHFCEYT